MESKNLRNLTWEYRNSPYFQGKSVEDIMKFLKKNNKLTYENVIKILNKFDYETYTPDIVAYFLANFSKTIKAETILDPFAQYGKLVFEVSKHNTGMIKAVSINIEGAKIIESFAGEKISVCRNDFMEMEHENKYDLIVSDLPLAAKKEDIYNGMKINDLGLNIVAKCINLLNDDGYIIVTFSNNIVHSEKSLRILRHFEENSLFVNGVIDIPIGTYAPKTNIPTKFVIFSKKKSAEKFIAQMSNIDDCDEIVKCFVNGINSKNAENGLFIEHTKYADFSMYQRDINNLKLIKPFAGKLSSIKEIKNSIHRPDSNNNFQDIQNSIFIPKIGISKVVTSVDDFEIKAQNYIQVALNQELVSAKYASFFFNVPEGRHIRRKYQMGNYISSYNLATIEKVPFILPDNKTQADILDVYQEVEEVEAQLIAVKNKLLNNPAAYKNVQNGVKNINNTETLDDWIESIPFPVATILRKYITSSSNRDKQEILLKFFEALSELFATIFLSVMKRVNKILKGSEILNDFDIDSAEKASFGTWVKINSDFTKYVRVLLSGSAKKRDLVYLIFETSNTSIIERLCNKDLHKIIDKARERRNRWEAHSGIYSDATYLEHVEILHEELLKVRRILADVFDEVCLVRASAIKKASGLFINSIDLLMGSNRIFKKSTFESQVDALDSDLLYLQLVNSNRVIELMPIILMDPINNECHFYSRTNKMKTEYISYNQEDNHEKEVLGDYVFNCIKDVFDDLNDNS
ncbi:hypothetical protein QJV45_04295 [Listeria booriae]|uniref:hypothetical protein n=1 Tax=Listeria booriae TaxID=1552123 RepID=UPI0028802F55|nr:hypothetical protein [Listeria booriae]MDT0109668.1 hypothetical protein [Listeria booriae]